MNFFSIVGSLLTCATLHTTGHFSTYMLIPIAIWSIWCLIRVGLRSAVFPGSSRMFRCLSDDWRCQRYCHALKRDALLWSQLVQKADPHGKEDTNLDTSQVIGITKTWKRATRLARAVSNGGGDPALRGDDTVSQAHTDVPKGASLDSRRLKTVGGSMGGGRVPLDSIGHLGNIAKAIQRVLEVSRRTAVEMENRGTVVLSDLLSRRTAPLPFIVNEKTKFVSVMGRHNEVMKSLVDHTKGLVDAIERLPVGGVMSRYLRGTDVPLLSLDQMRLESLETTQGLNVIAMMPDGVSLDCLWVPSLPPSAQGGCMWKNERGAAASQLCAGMSVVLLTGPNAAVWEDSHTDDEVIDIYKERGWSVFLFNYRGFSRSEGQPTPDLCTSDALTLLRYIRAAGAVKLALHGRSIGGMIAADVMRRMDKSLMSQIHWLALDRTFGKLTDVASQNVGRPAGWLVRIAGWNRENVKPYLDATCPKALLYDPEDGIVRSRVSLAVSIGKHLIANENSRVHYVNCHALRQSLRRSSELVEMLNFWITLSACLEAAEKRTYPDLTFRGLLRNVPSKVVDMWYRMIAKHRCDETRLMFVVLTRGRDVLAPYTEGCSRIRMGEEEVRSLAQRAVLDSSIGDLEDGLVRSRIWGVANQDGSSFMKDDSKRIKNIFRDALMRLEDNENGGPQNDGTHVAQQNVAPHTEKASVELKLVNQMMKEMSIFMETLADINFAFIQDHIVHKHTGTLVAIKCGHNGMLSGPERKRFVKCIPSPGV